MRSGKTLISALKTYGKDLTKLLIIVLYFAVFIKYRVILNQASEHPIPNMISGALLLWLILVKKKRDPMIWKIFAKIETIDHLSTNSIISPYYKSFQLTS